MRTTWLLGVGAIEVTSGRIVATREVFGHFAEVVSLAPAER